MTDSEALYFLLFIPALFLIHKTCALFFLSQAYFSLASAASIRSMQRRMFSMELA